MKSSQKLRGFVLTLLAGAACGCNPAPHPTHPSEITCKFQYSTRCSATFALRPADPNRGEACTGALQTWAGSSGFIERKGCVQASVGRAAAYSLCQARFASDLAPEASCDHNRPGGFECPDTLRQTPQLTPITDVDSDPSPLRTWGPNDCSSETRLPLLGSR